MLSVLIISVLKKCIMLGLLIITVVRYNQLIQKSLFKLKIEKLCKLNAVVPVSVTLSTAVGVFSGRPAPENTSGDVVYVRHTVEVMHKLQLFICGNITVLNHCNHKNNPPPTQTHTHAYLHHLAWNQITCGYQNILHSDQNINCSLFRIACISYD